MEEEEEVVWVGWVVSSMAGAVSYVGSPPSSLRSGERRYARAQQVLAGRSGKQVVRPPVRVRRRRAKRLGVHFAFCLCGAGCTLQPAWPVATTTPAGGGISEKGEKLFELLIPSFLLSFF